MIDGLSRLRFVLMITIFGSGMLSASIAAEPAASPDVADTHPLLWTVRYATSLSENIRSNVRDYSCRLIKRERIDGELQEHQFIQVQVRCEQAGDDHDVCPMAVFMQFLAPPHLKGRKILYVDGQNDGMLQVVKGGRTLKFLKLKIDPNGSAARRESNYPITDVTFEKIIARLIERVRDDLKNDPDGVNTQVLKFRNARVADRVCTHIRVVHPERGAGIEFHAASLYIDDELRVPIHLSVHTWPETEGDAPPLIEEYTYVDLQLNVGLTDADFSSARLETSTVGTNVVPTNSSKTGNR